MKKQITSIITAITCAVCTTGGVQPLIASAGKSVITGHTINTYSDIMEFGEYLSYEKEDVDWDGDYDRVIIYSCDESVTEIEIPEEIDGLPVTEIDGEAFQRCTELKSVKIPGSIKTIGWAAFKQCTSLTSVTIPEGVESIGSEAFANCLSLTDISIPGSVTAVMTDVFSETPWLEERQNEGMPVIGCNILLDGTGCGGDVVIPDGVKVIARGAFSGCTDIKSVTIPDSVAGIGANAFYGCTGLESIIIPGSVKSIGDSAFSGCTGLTEAVISEGVETINDDAFRNCTNLEDVKIGSSVTNIGYNPFSATAWLEARQKENPMVIVNNVLIDGTTCRGDVVIPDGVTVIGDNAFCGTGLVSVTIPDSVTVIDYAAFGGCSELEEITLPEGLTEIRENAFYECRGLRSITLPDSLKILGTSAFCDCSSITSVVVPKNIRYLGAQTFWGCLGLESITISNPECDMFGNSTITNVFSNDGLSYTGIIYGYRNSTAQAYAVKYGYKFAVIGEDGEISGDANGDGKLNVRDAAFIAQKIAKGKINELPQSADFNGDGVINVRDAAAIAKSLASAKK